MGWFDEQVKQRMHADDHAFSEALSDVLEVINGNTAYDFDPHENGIQSAVDVILKFYHLKGNEAPIELTDFEEQLEYLLHPLGVMRRTVQLKGTWYRNATGAFLAKLEDDTPVALLPAKFGGYRYYHTTTGKWVHINHKTAVHLKEEALCFYKPLPLKKLKIRDLLIFILQTLSVTDYLFTGLAMLATTLIGLLNPYLNKLLFSQVIVEGNLPLLASVGVMLVSVAISIRLIGLMSSFLNSRVQQKTDMAVEAAAMMRLLSLPTKFFGDYNTGQVSTRMQSLQGLCTQLSNAIFTTGLSSIFSLVYLRQIFAYAPSLFIPSLCITLATIGISWLTMVVQMKISKRSMDINAKETGLTYALVNGVQKLKLAGAEKRAFAKWAAIYREKAQLLYNPPTLVKLNTLIQTAISTIGSLVLYYFAVVSSVSVADYFAFQSAYGMVSGAIQSLFGMATSFGMIKPVLDMVKPILDTIPETSASKPVITCMQGGVELSNLSFRYSESTPFILKDLSLKITPGQYVAIVGKTGCGKSTLVRLLLGFETPQKGAVYYDNHDLSTVDLRSIRRSIGVVLQNGKLSAGDIFSNITRAAPWLTLDQAWEAAEIAGVAKDIRAMPMGMFTLLSEGSGGISGGQRQRLMIARAVAAKPRLLLLDEATSALDNLTQKAVVESLSRFNCTRIVIAHRLTTIKECDRILLLEDGRIAEDGSYDELIAKNGKFTQLVAHQQLEEITGDKSSPRDE